MRFGRRVRSEARGRKLPLAGENRDEENREDAAAGLGETGGSVSVVRGAHRFRCPRVPGPGSICQEVSAGGPRIFTPESESTGGFPGLPAHARKRLDLVRVALYSG